jgi:hypothetical protein
MFTMLAASAHVPVARTSPVSGAGALVSVMEEVGRKGDEAGRSRTVTGSAARLAGARLRGCAGYVRFWCEGQTSWRGSHHSRSSTGVFAAVKRVQI